MSRDKMRKKEESRSGILEIFGIDILGLVMFMCICLYRKESKIKLFQ
jgi:hypothetical protein